MLPDLLTPWQGPRDFYKLLFVVGPVAMIASAL